MIGVKRALMALIVVLAGLVAPSAAQAASTTHYEGVLRNGTAWIADVPADWNGTVVLYSHGYNPFPVNPPANAPDSATADALLDRGYALAGSSYSRSGWVADTAAQDQLDTLAAVGAQIGAPRHAIAVGTSFGGLITGQLAERAGRELDGALATCGLMSGGIDVLNYQLDGMHAIARLLLAGQSVKLVNFGSVAEAVVTAQRMVAALDEAQSTPQGRARIALIAALFQEPGWVRGQPEPALTDHQAQQQGQYQNLRAILPFIVPGRFDIEQNAGGNPSWNAGVDYDWQLARSGRAEFVKSFYRRAGLALKADLGHLTQAAEVNPDNAAYDWMTRTSVLNGDLDVPMLTLHTSDDDLAPASVEEEYAEDVRSAGAGNLLRQAYTGRAGHCTFTPAELVAAVQTVEDRIETGRWEDFAKPGQLQARAEELDLGSARFVQYRPEEFLGDHRLP